MSPEPATPIPSIARALDTAYGAQRRDVQRALDLLHEASRSILEVERDALRDELHAAEFKLALLRSELDRRGPSTKAEPPA